MDLDLDLEGTIGISSFFISAGIEQRIRYAEMDAKILTRINSVPEMQRYRPTQVLVSDPEMQRYRPTQVLMCTSSPAPLVVFALGAMPSSVLNGCPPILSCGQTPPPLLAYGSSLPLPLLVVPPRLTYGLLIHPTPS